MRNIINVIDSIIEIAPDLEKNLSSIRRSAQYAAPEAMTYWWNQLALELNYSAYKHAKEAKIGEIFSGEKLELRMNEEKHR
jgi:hypothetical protein